MDSDFFQEGEYQQSPQNNYQQTTNHNTNEDNIWQQGQPQNTNAQWETAHTLGSQNVYNSNPIISPGSSTALDVEDEVNRKIREQQDRINQLLRQKANKEYEQKQARKEAGRAQIQQFYDKKEKQKQSRREHNIEHQKEILNNARQLNQTAGWKKVFENVNLKLGEYKGAKPVNRMRQAIINKRQDQKNSL